jgi:hypothetical protein
MVPARSFGLAQSHPRPLLCLLLSRQPVDILQPSWLTNQLLVRSLLGPARGLACCVCVLCIYIHKYKQTLQRGPPAEDGQTNRMTYPDPTMYVHLPVHSNGPRDNATLRIPYWRIKIGDNGEKDGGSNSGNTLKLSSTSTFCSCRIR